MLVSIQIIKIFFYHLKKNIQKGESVTSRDYTASSNKQNKEPVKESRQYHRVRDFTDATYSQMDRSTE